MQTTYSRVIVLYPRFAKPCTLWKFNWQNVSPGYTEATHTTAICVASGPNHSEHADTHTPSLSQKMYFPLAKDIAIVRIAYPLTATDLYGYTFPNTLKKIFGSFMLRPSYPSQMPFAITQVSPRYTMNASIKRPKDTITHHGLNRVILQHWVIQAITSISSSPTMFWSISSIYPPHWLNFVGYSNPQA